MTNKNEQIQAAVIGYGGAFNMGRAHGQQINAAGMKTVMACDIDRLRVDSAKLDFPGIRTTTDIDEVLGDKSVDLVVVILPHNLHADVAIRAAKAGKHVIVEKPMCITVAEADAMISAAQTAGTMLSVYHNRRHDADFIAVRNLVKEGMIGDVFQMESCMGGYHKPGTWWRSSKEISGGTMFDWGAHVLDWTFHYITEEIIGVDGYYQKRVWSEVTNEDHTNLTIRFKGGATATVEQSNLAAAPKARLRMLGTKGAIVQPNWDEIKVSVEHNGHIATFDAHKGQGTHDQFYKNIRDHLVDGAELDVKPEQARRIISTIEAAEESSKLGRTVVPKYV